MNRVAMVAVLGVLGGCGLTESAGPIVSVDRAVSGFDEVNASGALAVEIDVGGPQGAVVVCGERAEPHVRTRVSGTVLSIDVDSQWRGNLGSCTVHVRLPELFAVVGSGSGEVEVFDATSALAQVRHSGSGRMVVGGEALDVEQVTSDGSGLVQINDLDADDIDVSLSGSGSVELSGEARDSIVSLSGSGAVRAQALTVRDSDVQLDGSGLIEVRATRRADVEISGSGTVRVFGGANVSSQIDGSGRVVEDGA